MASGSCPECGCQFSDDAKVRLERQVLEAEDLAIRLGRRLETVHHNAIRRGIDPTMPSDDLDYLRGTEDS